jgi:transposase
VVELLEHFLPDTDQIRLERWNIDTANTNLQLTIASTQTIAQCPLCQQFSHRVHSRYERRLQDLALAHYSLTLQLRVRKFFCGNLACTRQIFTERLSQVVSPWARKTMRLVGRLQQIGLALGGAAGARLAHHLGNQACGSTLLNHLKQLPLPQFEVPQVLGVDDFALRKGRQYGTILVDLERHQPIALLEDRKAETLATWLTQHPGVKVLSRDRSKVYRSGMTQGAPDARQVADRFHLVQNLAQTLEQVFLCYSSQLKAVEQKQRQALAPTDTVIVKAKPTATATAQARTQAVHQQRVQQQQEIKELYQQQWSQRAIAQKLGITERTVRRYLSLPQLASTPPRRKTFGRSLLEPSKQMLLEWWNGGLKQPRLLMSLLQQQGYTGSERTLTRYISQLRAAQGLPAARGHCPQSSVKVSDPQSLPLTARRASYLVVKRQEHRQSEDDQMLEQIVAAHPDLAVSVKLADEFLQLLRQQKADGLEEWLRDAIQSSLKPFERFAQGLIEDYAAVKAGLMLPVSNGAVEGLNNRLKMLKRQMYGRAGLELLERRFLLAI